MSLEIHSPKADALAHELAAMTGEDIDTAVERAIEERLARIPRTSSQINGSEIDALFESLAQMPVRDARPPDEIMGYGPDGLPG
jgi:antitoxin VapB